MRPLTLVAVLAALAVGCGEDDNPAGGGTGGGGTAPGTAIRPDDFRGARFTVGSKEFTEQLVLGQITVEALKAGGALVRDNTGLKGSEAARRALTSGDIDMYGLAVRREARRPLDVQTISDLGNLLERTYGFEYPRNLIVTMPDEGRIYEEIDKGARCTFGEIFLTDGRIIANDLVVLEDDKGFSTTYNPALNVRSGVVRKYPELEELFNAIASKLDRATLRGLNAGVDVEGRAPDEVARSFLDANGFIG